MSKTTGSPPEPARRRPRFALAGAALALLMLPTAGAAADAAKDGGENAASRLIFVSWDGGGDVEIDRLLEEGRLPHLSALRARGTSAAHLYGTLPTKTAPSHASIYTGCGPGVNGIAANRTLAALRRAGDGNLAGHTLLETGRGFSSRPLRAEPLFATTARAGRKTVVLSATQYIPHADLGDDLDAPLYTSFSGFEGEIAAARVYTAAAIGPELTAAAAAEAGWRDLPPHAGAVREVELEIAGLSALILDSDQDPSPGYDRLLLRESAGGEVTATALLEARTAHSAPRQESWSPLLRLRGGGDGDGGGEEASGLTSFRLFELSGDASSMVLYRRRATQSVGRHDAEQAAAFLAVDSGSHDVPFPAYVRGSLGEPVTAGGDGRAEERLLEIVAKDLDLRLAGAEFVWRAWRPDALFLYSPISDQAGHAWLGALDPQSGVYDPSTAARLWPYYARLFGHLDRWLGSLARLAADEAVLALVSDHGMAGVSRLLYLPGLLERAGLLAFADDGSIDLARTRILPAESNFFLRVNADRFTGGIVPPEEHGRAVERAANALLGAVDQASGRRPVRRVFTRSQLQDFSALGPTTGDLYFDLAPGYYPTERDSRRTPGAIFYPVPFAIGQGSHGFWPGRRDMHAIFYLAGPGVAAGRAAPAARQIDVAPTLSHLLGISAPRQSCGRILAEALDEFTPAAAAISTPPEDP